MRPLPLLLLLFIGSLAASEPAYPIWDGVESVADYAKKVYLPPTKTLELGDNVKMELVLIPAGKFTMGTPPPTPVDEAGFSTKIARGQLGLAVSGGALLILLGFVLAQAIRKRRHPQVSLGLLLLVTVATGGCVLSGLHWRKSVQALEAAKIEYAAAKARAECAVTAGYLYTQSQPETPAHPVTLTKAFYMGKFVVTQEQYRQVTGNNPSSFIGKNNPVEQIAWDEAHNFCEKLTAQGKQTVRLPTEAEWEYACRAGTTTAYYSGDGEADLSRVAWYSGNSKKTTHPVGEKEPNAFGLYDMHGNVWQWCADWLDETYYSKSPAENPEGPAKPDFGFHLLRGGSWNYEPMACRSANRYWSDSGFRFHVGFRIVSPASTLP